MKQQGRKTTMTFINTDERYHAIINAPDMEIREQLYQEYFLKSWETVMRMMSGAFGSDPYGVARAWGWLLPEDLTTEPEQLRIMEGAGAWEMGAQAMRDAVHRFKPFADRIGLDLEAIEGWLILANPRRAEPTNRGYTGAIDYASGMRLVVQYDTPNADNLPKLKGAMVHEFNHLVRGNVKPWNMMTTTVGEYIVHEGLAESFAASLYGEGVVGYYVTEITPHDLEKARTLIREGVERTGFDVIRGYIFGDWTAERWGTVKVGMPNFGGYAVGYHVVQAYLKKTGCSIEEATLMTDAHEMIRISGYLDEQFPC
jgi:uncharacterized protein YjaZ